MAEFKKNISEAIDEVKHIPKDDELDGLMSVYKVVDDDVADNFKQFYHRKLSAGWLTHDRDCYGILAYTTASLYDARGLLGGYGYSIVEFKLLGGVKDYVFFDSRYDNRIKDMMIKSYGRVLSVREQLYELTGNEELANKYGNCGATEFGKYVQHEIRTKYHYFLRGMVCSYGGAVAVYPFVFSDLITYRIAKNLPRNASVEYIESKLEKSLDELSRKSQEEYIDLVPHMQALGLSMSEADVVQSKMIDGVFYVPYSTRRGEHNIAIIDDAEFVRPVTKKLFPDGVKIEQTPTISVNGEVSFKMRGLFWEGNIKGKGSGLFNGSPVFCLNKKNAVWLPWTALPAVYKNPRLALNAKLINGKLYCQYITKEGNYNIAKIDENNGEVNNLFDDSIMLDEAPTLYNDGSISFKMHGLTWCASVTGKDFDGYQVSSDGNPIFSLTGNDGEWFAWDSLQYVYDHPEWVRENLQPSLNEEFKPGMSVDEFANSNDNAIGYVCAHGYSVDGILTHGFSREFANANDFRQNGGQLTYGDGQYGSVTLNNAANNLSRKTGDKADGLKYGNVILKCVINGGWKNFLIFDGRLARQVYGENWKILDQIDVIIKDKEANRELKNYAKQYLNCELYDPSNDYCNRTNHIIFHMFNDGNTKEQRQLNVKKWTDFFRKNGIRGAIYHGMGDRYCFVCYDFTEVVPIAASYDYGQTFTSGPNTWTDRAGTHSTNGINWEETSKRLEYNVDAIQKLSHLYKSVAKFPKRIQCNGKVFGCVNVEKNNGRFNCVDTITSTEIFPVDFDIAVPVSFRGNFTCKYKGYTFNGIVYNEGCDGPSIDTPYGTFSMNDIDSVIYYYYQGHINDVQQDDSNYEEQDADAQQQEIAESFFKLLDKLETL